MTRFHVLLIGIDAYAKRPLAGCVNDIDRVQRLLLGPRVGLPENSIRRLASPRPGAHHETRIPELPATLDNIRAALAELASDAVAPDDRVFIYYAGHGFQYAVRASGLGPPRRAFAPVDATQGKLLFDLELNRLLAAIAARARSVTIVVDCCYSIGVTRSPSAGMVARCLHPDDIEVPPEAFSLGPGLGLGVGGSLAAEDDPHVIVACLTYQSAYESDRGGVCHGLLTRALVEELEAVEDVDLRAVSWPRIWEGVRARVIGENSAQNVCMHGSARRAVLAGPPVSGDAGFAITMEGSQYRIHAGTLAGITAGAEIGVYGEQPAFFPPVDSDEDDRARIGTLTVTEPPQLATAIARAASPFALPANARGRLVKTGEPDRVRCALVGIDPDVKVAVSSSPLLEITETTDAAQVCLEQSEDGMWSLTDDVHPCTRPLFRFHGDAQNAREILEHYTRYVRPVQIATRVIDIRGLAVTLHSYPRQDLGPAEAQVADLPQAHMVARDVYQLDPDARFALRVYNPSPQRLRVTLVNCSALGRVQVLGEEIIDAGAWCAFWAGGSIGKPFALAPPTEDWIDRIVAIGRTNLSRELSFVFRVDKSFSEVLERTRGAKDFGDRAERSAEPAEQWTARQIVVRVSGAGHGVSGRPFPGTEARPASQASIAQITLIGDRERFEATICAAEIPESRQLSVNVSAFEVEAAIELAGGAQRWITAESVQVDALRDIGRRLMDAFLETSLPYALRAAEDKGEELQLRIAAQGPVAALPWELLVDRGRARGDFLALSSRTPIVRRPSDRAYQGSREHVPSVRPKLLLLIASKLETVDRLVVQLEHAAQNDTLELCVKHTSGFDRVFFSALEGSDSDILHVAASEADLKAGGRVPGLFGGLIADHLASSRRPPKLALMMVCRGHEAAIPLMRVANAVISVRGDITDKAAVAFETAFYDSLLDGNTVVQATTRGRQAVNRHLPGDRQWSLITICHADGELVLRERSRPVPAMPEPAVLPLSLGGDPAVVRKRIVLQQAAALHRRNLEAIEQRLAAFKDNVPSVLEAERRIAEQSLDRVVAELVGLRRP